MSILQSQLAPQPTPAQAAGDKSIAIMNAIRTMMANQYNFAIRTIHKNPSAALQDILTAFGTNAVQLFALGQITADFISCIDFVLANPSQFPALIAVLEGFRAANHVADFSGIQYPAVAVTINEDGSATATTTPYTPPTY